MTSPSGLRTHAWAVTPTTLPALVQSAVRHGFVADLVLLDADPLADVSAVRRIRAVVAGGAPLRPLDALLASGAASVGDEN